MIPTAPSRTRLFSVPSSVISTLDTASEKRFAPDAVVMRRITFAANRVAHLSLSLGQERGNHFLREHEGREGRLSGDFDYGCVWKRIRCELYGGMKAMRVIWVRRRRVRIAY
jgi:hypothetical protein